MPSENIERAIKRGSGEMGGAALVEMTLEGYGPGGTAILVQALSDNRNRTLQDVRSVFTRHGGSLGESGCVAWIFDLKGLITVETSGLDTDELSLQAIDAGAEDVIPGTGCVEVYTKPEELEMVRTALEAKSIPIASSEQGLVPKTTIELDEKVALQTLKLLDKLEDIDEVQQVCSNVDFADAIVEKYQSQASG